MCQVQANFVKPMWHKCKKHLETCDVTQISISQVLAQILKIKIYFSDMLTDKG